MPQASPRGTFQVVAERLRTDLVKDKTSHRLPSEAQLMRTYGIGRSTVRRALEVLAAEGLVESVPGVGWRLADGCDPHQPLIDRLTQMIVADNLQIGDRFPPEAALCERFKMSRTAIRRALAQLEGRGVLEAQHGKGRVVRTLPHENGTS